MYGIWGLAWLIATSILIFFVNTFGWKSLARWQQWYVVTAAVIVPIWAFEQLLFPYGSPGDSPFHQYVMIGLMLMSELIMAIGVVIGVLLWLQMTRGGKRDSQ